MDNQDATTNYLEAAKLYKAGKISADQVIYVANVMRESFGMEPITSTDDLPELRGVKPAQPPPAIRPVQTAPAPVQQISQTVIIKEKGGMGCFSKLLVGVAALIVFICIAGLILSKPNSGSTTSSSSGPIQLDYISPSPAVASTVAVPAKASNSNGQLIVSAPQATATNPPPPTAQPVVQPIKLTGKGQQATSKFRLAQGLSVFQMTHDGKSNFAIKLLDSSGDLVDLLVNEIGSFSGSKAAAIESQGDYLLDISADGNWSISIEQPRPNAAPILLSPLSGKGQQASLLFSLKGGLATFKMTHDGKSNFAIKLLDSDGNMVDLLVNEIGNFNGSKAARIDQVGLYLLDIAADGNWSVSIAQ